MLLARGGMGDGASAVLLDVAVDAGVAEAEAADRQERRVGDWPPAERALAGVPREGDATGGHGRGWGRRRGRQLLDPAGGNDTMGA